MAGALLYPSEAPKIERARERAMIVLKFGGTSVANPVNIGKIIEISTRARAERGAAAIICSAFSGVTNGLIRLAQLAAQRSPEMPLELDALCLRHREAVIALVPDHCRDEADEAIDQMLADLHDVLHGIHLLREASSRSLDYVMSFGERLSCRIISYALRRHIPDADYLDARKVVRTDKHFGLARVDWPATRELIRTYFHEHQGLQVVTGFIGASADECTTTLGRGGSDYTASIVGAALMCEEIQIWTDVSGVLTADPRKVRDVLPVPTMSYEEAMEVAHFGAKVIYPPTMAPAMAAKIPLRILNTFEPDAPGTLIGVRSESRGASAITSIESVALVQLKGPGLIGVAGFASRLFGAVAQAGINVILISQASSEHSICFAIRPEDAELAREVVSREFEYEIHKGEVDQVQVDLDQSIIAVVGEGMRNCPGISGRIFSALGRTGVNVDAIAQGSSELNISLVVKRADEHRALNTLHEAFFATTETTRLFLVGHGLIGRELMRQLAALLERPDAPQIKLCGLANSRVMVLHDQGLPLSSALVPLEQGRPTNLDELFAQMRLCPNAVLVDCTAGQQVQLRYEEALTLGIPVVTPNKIANTSAYSRWRALRELARRLGVAFHYEANVGAGLPVIKTLVALVEGGDQIQRIDAVLSGTLSYLFNTYNLGESFTELLRTARENGFTEPDPRDDLSGTDVARKILILAREAGRTLELHDVEVENLVPEALRQGHDIEAFMSGLAAYDDVFEDRLRAAQAEGKVLRYVATLEDNRATVGLRAVGPDHPCYHLAGSDNLVSFTTDLYHERPLVVKGPGAGAQVTAAQCLSEILQLARQKR